MPSTVIRRFTYHPALAALDVEFVTGRVYRYRDVPEDVAHRLAAARSKGGWFNRAIRDRFGFVRLPRCPDDDAAAKT
jgi:hypothetical protein